MKRLFVFISIMFFVQKIDAQEQVNKIIDSLYKEDQFYIGVTNNLFGNKPADLSQSGFSSGFHLGFIKDMPINNNRNVAIGIGMGYSVNSFNENLLISKDNLGAVSYTILDDDKTYTKNKFSRHLLELPLEFRWRTSTPSEYNFWRIYTGFKFSYMFAHTTKYIGDLGSFKYTDIEDFNKFQYALTLSAGYNTWNIYMYYALNSIFSNNVNVDGQSLNMNAIKIGLMFYIL
ncbi:porin family protein [Thalassobellus suaedae]|uniref:Porin family protein n=1 Tax=Thalassobellus suaedae TaxID=3074124 RepID=A0ABY9Y8Y3_9FLAO|nr:porin family protein [Flavobacteriaceae bacterium HL-DH10]